MLHMGNPPRTRYPGAGLPSRARSRRFVESPPAALKPPSPEEPTTRCKGMKRQIRLRAIAFPTERAAPGLPAARATSA